MRVVRLHNLPKDPKESPFRFVNAKKESSQIRRELVLFSRPLFPHDIVDYISLAIKRLIGVDSPASHAGARVAGKSRPPLNHRSCSASAGWSYAAPANGKIERAGFVPLVHFSSIKLRVQTLDFAVCKGRDLKNRAMCLLRTT